MRDVMRHIPVQAILGWGGRARDERDADRMRLRDLLPAIATVFLIFVGLVAAGAVQPAVALSLSMLLIITAMVAITLAGPGSVSPAMLVGAAVIILLGVTGLAGPLHDSAPVLATLFAAGAVWTVGHLASTRRRLLDVIWSGMIWSAVAYCAWMFVAYVSTIQGQASASLADAFETPANGAVVFGFLSVLAMGRLLHLMKQIDAENLPRAECIDRLLRNGLAALLLLFASLGCLILVGWQPGMMLTGSVLLAYAWWDSLGITMRAHHGIRMRAFVILTPLLALALAAWGVWMAWSFHDVTATGMGASDTHPHLQRAAAYGAAWLESPLTGHGLGSAASEAARFHTLHNAKALLAPGGAQNLVMSWLVEAGVIGLVLIISVIGAIHLRITSALAIRRAPRSFPRMAFALTTFLVLHGLAGSSLNIPVLAWMYAIVLGCACGLAAGKGTQSSKLVV